MNSMPCGTWAISGTSSSISDGRRRPGSNSRTSNTRSIAARDREMSMRLVASTDIGCCTMPT